MSEPTAPRRRFPEIAASFDGNVEKALEILDMDKLIIEFTKECLNQLKNREYVMRPGIDLISKINQQLENVRAGESLRVRYDVLLNQLLVVVVSFFESTMSDLFTEAYVAAIAGGGFAEKAADEKMKDYTLAEFLKLRELTPERVAEEMTRKLGISFQNTKIITKSFEAFFGIKEVVPEGVMNDTICALECRHCLIHYSGLPDQRLKNVLPGIAPRTLKPDIDLSKQIQFDESDVRQAQKAMSAFIQAYAQALEKRLVS